MGKSKFGVKVTPLGQAYFDQIDKRLLSPNFSDPENIEFKLAILPSNGVFISSGKQKHLVVVYNKTTEEYHIIGYLTSKKSAMFLDNKQFKNYQDDKTGVQSKEVKKQYLMEFYNAETISKEELTFIAYGTEYLHSTLEFSSIEKLRKNLIKKLFTNYQSQNYTKQQGIEVCIAYDANMKNNKLHPQTDDQKVIVESNKVKQKIMVERLKFKGKMDKANVDENSANE